MANEVWSLKELITTISSIGQGIGGVAVLFTLIFIYKQRKDSLDAEQQINRARVTEAYLKLHATLMTDRDTCILAGKMLRRGWTIIGDNRDTHTEEDAREIHLIYMHLNALFTEWTYREAYNLPVEPFLQSVDNALSGLATHSQVKYQRITDNFWDIFTGYPDKFMTAVSGRFRYWEAQRPERGSGTPTRDPIAP